MKLQELTVDLARFEGKENLKDILRDQLAVEVYARSQYDSLLEMLGGYGEDEVVKVGEIKFVVGELRETVQKIREEEKEHVQEVEKALDSLEPALSG